MVESKTFVALIPARAGSQRLPGKNRMEIGGKSLAQIAIDSARRKPLVSAVVVSTDDSVIATQARERGAYVHERPRQAATSEATAADVVLSAADFLMENFGPNPNVIYLQPTSPLRSGKHVSDALELLNRLGAQKLISGCQTKENPFKTFTLSEDNLICPFFGNERMTGNAQALPKTFRANGAIYVFPLTDFLEKKEFPIAGSVFFEMSERESVDVDSPADFASIIELGGAYSTGANS